MRKTTFLCAAAFCGILAAGSQAQAQILGGGGGLGGGVGGGLGGLGGSATGSIRGAGSIDRPDISAATDTVRSTKNRVKHRTDNVRDRAGDTAGQMRDTARSVDGSASVGGSANAGASGADASASVSANGSADTSMVGDTARRAKGALSDTRQRATRTARGAVGKAKSLRPDVDASAGASGSAGAEVRR